MKDKHSAYWDGWLSRRDGIPQEYNPYHEERQAFSHREWHSGYWARCDAERDDRYIDIEKYDWYAISGDRY